MRRRHLPHCNCNNAPKRRDSKACGWFMFSLSSALSCTIECVLTFMENPEIYTHRVSNQINWIIYLRQIMDRRRELKGWPNCVLVFFSCEFYSTKPAGSKKSTKSVWTSTNQNQIASQPPNRSLIAHCRYSNHRLWSSDNLNFILLGSTWTETLGRFNLGTSLSSLDAGTLRVHSWKGRKVLLLPTDCHEP